jgi:hypothetical protein
MIARVGSEVDAWCTKCRMDLMHRVVAVLEAKPKRVECKTCNSQHNYRKPKGAVEPVPKGTKVKRSRDEEPSSTRSPAAAAPRKAKRMTKGETELLTQWEARVPGKPPASFLRYSVQRAFGENQLVEHAKFGQGFVAQVLEDNKINVVFRDGQRVLAHGRA